MIFYTIKNVTSSEYVSLSHSSVFNGEYLENSYELSETSNGSPWLSTNEEEVNTVFRGLGNGSLQTPEFTPSKTSTYEIIKVEF